MGLELPSELTEPLSWIGLVWPEADEDLLKAAGEAWIGFARTLQAEAATANTAAATVWAVNSGASTDAFHTWWTGDDGPGKRFDDDARSALLIGEALIVFAGITLALKLAFITCDLQR